MAVLSQWHTAKLLWEAGTRGKRAGARSLSAPDPHGGTTLLSVFLVAKQINMLALVHTEFAVDTFCLVTWGTARA